MADGEGTRLEGAGATGPRQGDRACDTATRGRQPGSQGGEREGRRQQDQVSAAVQTWCMWSLSVELGSLVPW